MRSLALNGNSTWTQIDIAVRAELIGTAAGTREPNEGNHYRDRNCHHGENDAFHGERAILLMMIFNCVSET